MTRIVKNVVIYTILPFLIFFIVVNAMNFSVSSQNNLLHVLGFIVLIYSIFEIRKKQNIISTLNSTIDEKEKLSKELFESNKKLNSLVSTDFLTNIGNRRYFFDIGEKSFFKAKRNGSFLSLILLDIDDFKMINDEYGHQIGDDVLIKISQVLTGEIRKSDILGRVGGEEFAIVLPETDLDNAIQIAEKIRMKFTEIKCQKNSMNLKVTGSFGVSQINHLKDKDLDSIFARSDTALYKAKNGGKNRVCYA